MAGFHARLLGSALRRAADMERAHRQLGHAERVYDLTRLLLRRGALDETQARQFIRESAAQRLAQVDEAGWNAIWGDLSSKERQDPDIALAGAQAQVRLGHGAESGRILESALSRQLDDRLLRLYAACDKTQAGQRIGHAELWLKSNPDHPGLLAALGQLCLVAQLWGQGEHYLERSLALRSDTYIHVLLGNLHDALGHPEQALRNWRLACQAADADMPVVDRLLPPADTGSDPRFDTADLGDESLLAATPVTAPYAASGVYVQDETDITPEAVSVAAPIAPAEPPVQAAPEDEYFDTAPIPGVDMSQTSDGSART